MAASTELVFALVACYISSFKDLSRTLQTCKTLLLAIPTLVTDIDLADHSDRRVPGTLFDIQPVPFETVILFRPQLKAIFTRFHKLQKLNLMDRDGACEAIERLLPGFQSNLTNLNLEGTKTDSLSHLRFCPLLCALNIGRTNIRDLKTLPNTTRLHTLDLNSTRVCDISPLARFTDLHTLTLALTRVIDISSLATCTKLHKLLLSDTEIVSIDSLRGCIALHTLDLTGTSVVDISALAFCVELQILSICGTQVEDIGPLESSIKLRHLYLENTPVAVLAPLSCCLLLEVIKAGGLRGCYINDVSFLAACASLQTLELQNNTRLKNIAALGSCSQLRKLDLEMTLIKNISTLGGCTNLQVLLLNYTGIDDIAALDECVHLQILELINTGGARHLISSYFPCLFTLCIIHGNILIRCKEYYPFVELR